MVAESWFRSLWKSSKKHDVGPEKMRIGVLAFEVASLMSKLVHQWNSLGDKQITKLREEISNSLGIKKLVSDDDDYIVDLICAEMLQNLENVARAVIRLSKKCTDPLVKNFERAYDDLIKIAVDQYQWQFTWRKMSKKVRKMERFILVNGSLYQEMETLAELEQILRRMKGSDEQDKTNIGEYIKKIAWKQQEVKRLKEISLWNRTHDYTVLLLARSIFTIFCRIGHVFGINHVLPPDIEDSGPLDSDHIHRSQSVSVLHSSFHPSEYRIGRFSSGPLGNIIAKSGPISRPHKINNFYSGPLGNPSTGSGPKSVKNKHMGFYSGPLGEPPTKSGPLARVSKGGLRLWQTRGNSSIVQGKNLTPNRLSTAGPFKGCKISGNGSPVKNCHLNANAASSGTIGGIQVSTLESHPHGKLVNSDFSNCSSKQRIFTAPPETLGGAALALHYANVIIVLEKLVASPHLIGHDARDDLYNMLPGNVRANLRAKLKPYAKGLASSVYDAGLAGEWSEAMSGILEWLAPLAHNMIRWQSERSFERQNLLSKTNVLLVQTLYFANQAKTEATITELLLGLNYIWRFGRELNAKALLECESGRTIDDSLNLGSEQLM